MNRYIYVWQDGVQDSSRWLELSPAANGEITLLLSDLCTPGRVSGLTQVSLPIAYLEGMLSNGAVQVVNPIGFVVLRRMDEQLLVEFKGLDDAIMCKVCVLASHVADRLHEIHSGARAQAI